MFSKQEIKELAKINPSLKYLDTPDGQKAIDEGLEDAAKLEDKSLL